MRGDGYRAAWPRCIRRFSPGLSDLDDISVRLSEAGRNVPANPTVIPAKAGIQWF